MNVKGFDQYGNNREIAGGACATGNEVTYKPVPRIDFLAGRKRLLNHGDSSYEMDNQQPDSAGLQVVNVRTTELQIAVFASM
jgi:hypothetical protein